ncbi:MAG: ASKHA domain-containing protein [Oscillospiraceae bacterium]|nr:ASKHA domain-containing protein [Oscillospiraceae bacterium]
MMPKIRIFRSGELIAQTEAIIGETLLDRINAVGVFIDAPCGGKGRCGKCLVRLSPEGEQILACKTLIEKDTDIYLPEEMDMMIAGAESSASLNLADRPYPPSQGKKLGVAIDVGTTTVVAHLTDIVSGMRIATASGVNAQRPYGADVISRIQYCAENGHARLTQLIREQIESLIRHTCTISGERARDIGYIAIAANTIMQHLAAGFSPVGMGVAPFEPVSYFGDEHPAWDGLAVGRGAKIYYAPAISAYVGGDITAGMLAAKLNETNGPTVYLDIGTNGEIAMKSGATYYCCATAAGPAFEGAEITMGMAAISGAINHVKWEDGMKLSIIGEKEPQGLCGSGLLDALAVLLDTGAVDETGRLLDPDEIDHAIAEHIGKVCDENVFWLSKTGDGVYMSAKDIRKLQLAKAAIAAGIYTLLQQAGFAANEVKSFVLAGGFGSYMDHVSAAKIGLFPEEFLPITQTMGNTAGEGAALAVRSAEARVALDEIRAHCEYVELSTSKVFNDAFIEHILFNQAI